MHQGVTRSRVRPRIWNTDWLVLRALARAIEEQAVAPLQPGAVAVDFGCGSSPYRQLFTDRGVTYRGADLDEDAELPILADGTVPLGDASAQLVLSVQVLEHVRDPIAYLSECRRLIGPDGTLFLSTHGTWLYHPHPEDHRRWTRTGLVLDLEKAGLRVERMNAIAGPLATSTIMRASGYSYILRRIPLLGTLLAGAVSFFMNLRALAEDSITPRSIREDNGCVFWVKAVRA